MASSASVLRLDGKPPIRRKRTGCFTCRKRRKKCDEAKPLCENCRRTGVICEGYPSETIWRGGCLRARSSSGTPRPPKSQTPLPQVQLAAAPQIAQVIEEPILSWDDGGLFADDMDLMFESLDPSQVAPTTPPAAYQPTFLSPSIYRQQRAPSIPMELPFLINGIETRTEQRLFVHFTQHVSTLLTLCTDDKSNPFVSIVVPFAIKDPTIMQSLLCMAVSHLINLKGPDAELLAEKQRLHSVAVRTQTQRFEALDARNSAPSPREVEAILTSSLLLCLYEICEGSADGGWHLHLNSARSLIRKTAAMGPSNGNNIDMSSSISVAAGALPQINRFLLEFFIYHDTLATVTDLSQPALEPQVYRRSVSALTAGSGEAYLVGVHDGLFDIMAPISSLRAQADLSPLDVDGSVVCEAVAIWQALAEWHPPPSANPEVALIGSLYQWALFTWLYSVIYPDEITNSKVQLAVKNGLGSMQQIQPSSGAMSCLLFPLFILGSAAVDPGDRAVISIQFQRLRAWSRLNNITVAHEVVKTLWSKYDRGEPKSWDWVKELEARGLSLLVT